MCYSSPSPSFLDNISKVATIVIALFNIFFAIYVFVLKNKKDRNDKTERHNIDLFKEIILKPNISYYFTFIDNLYRLSNGFMENGLTIKNKIDINAKLEDEFISFRRKFISLIGAVNSSLQYKIQSQSDEIQGSISEIVFNEKIDLTSKLNFDSNISETISNFNQRLISDLFSYKGEFSGTAN